MIVVDEYLAIRSLLGDVPVGLPDEPLALTTSAHWRILQRIHSPSGGQMSQALSALSPAGLAHGRQLWFGNPRNIGIRLREIADDLDVVIHVAA